MKCDTPMDTAMSHIRTHKQELCGAVLPTTGPPERSKNGIWHWWRDTYDSRGLRLVDVFEFLQPLSYMNCVVDVHRQTLIMARCFGCCFSGSCDDVSQQMLFYWNYCTRFIDSLACLFELVLSIISSFGLFWGTLWKINVPLAAMLCVWVCVSGCVQLYRYTRTIFSGFS